MTRVTNRLRVLRAERRWNQMDVAEKLGVGVNRYWKIENERAEPDPAEVSKLARIFGKPVAEIFPNRAA